MPDSFQMADQFRGLPMGDLIGGPLQAACDAQVRLALATANFIQQIGFMPADTSAQPDPTKPATPSKVRTVDFRFDRPSPNQPAAAADGTKQVDTKMETVDLTVPLLAIVKVPALSITSVDVVFDMEVKNSERTSQVDDTKGAFSADASVGWGPFSLKVHVEGSVSSHKENTRETDQTAKYHVEVHAEDKGMPEGLSRVLDMMLQSIAPKSVTPVGSGGNSPAGDTMLKAPTPAAALGAPSSPSDPVDADGLDHADSAEPTSAAVSIPAGAAKVSVSGKAAASHEDEERIVIEGRILEHKKTRHNS